MLQVDMTARRRQTIGKGAARSLRRSGQTPAVLYGPKLDNMSLELETKAFTKTLLFIHGQNALISLDIINGDQKIKKHVMLKEVQADPVKDTVVHADFYEISLEKPMVLPVPLKIKGTAKGVELGGEIHIQKQNVTLKGLVMDIPDFIEIDVSTLEIGDGIKCQGLSIPEKVTLMEDGNASCVSVHEMSKAALMAGTEGEGAGTEAAAAEGASEETKKEEKSEKK